MTKDSKEPEIKDIIYNLEELPEGIKWNEEIGWEMFTKKYHHRIKKRTTQWMSAAASILILGIISGVIVFHHFNKPQIVSIKSNEINKEEITLNDGSRIWLNYNSSLKVDLKNNKIEIAGEAYFELSAKNTYRIFSPHGQYVSKAAFFNLRTQEKDNGAMLTVSKGKVDIIWGSDESQKAPVESGMQAKIVPQVAIVKTAIYDANYLSWKTETLHFENTPMYCVVDKLMEINNMEIEILNNNLRYCRVSSDFNTVSSTDVLRKITKLLNYNIIYTSGKIILKGNGCDL